MDALTNYQFLIQIDEMLSGFKPAFPYAIREEGKYTQHQITLYRDNYCHKDTEVLSEQPSVLGGSCVNIVLI